ncbi:hypothetical protein MGN70_004223 [Eutypa lata]|uniref:Uncharacterized protein n=1 Tax=Eutypa lata (strain UCR-EL1) TaxID=1287681 RepID=M7SXH5_EUTLA|nr:hypothetical protein UCREL1_1656 [Eutypa lata UCREL1]KAI1253828.1 hypothetical protein MGN70_004223 [Eutypa lata]
MRLSTLAALLTGITATFGYSFNICAEGGGCTTLNGTDDDSVHDFPPGYKKKLGYLKIEQVSSGCKFYSPNVIRSPFSVGATFEQSNKNITSLIEWESFRCWGGASSSTSAAVSSTTPAPAPTSTAG